MNPLIIGQQHIDLYFIRTLFRFQHLQSHLPCNSLRVEFKGSLRFVFHKKIHSIFLSVVLFPAFIAILFLRFKILISLYNLLNQQKEHGVAVIFVGEDLDVLTELCDRILVLCGGKITGILDGRKAKKEEIGLLMTKVEGGIANE